MPHRIDVQTLTEDGRAKVLEQTLERLHTPARVRIVDVYTIEGDLTPDQSAALSQSFVHPVTQKILHSGDEGAFDWAIEIGFLPGVTDNIGHTVAELLTLTLGHHAPVYSSQVFYLSGTLTHDDVMTIAGTLHNPLIQRATIKTSAQYKNDGGMGITLPKVRLSNANLTSDDVDLDVSDDALAAIGKDGILNPDGSRRGPLGMSLVYMKAVQSYFKTLGRAPKDIELETIAQTWSEHCKHTIFASPIDDIRDGLYKHYIKRATQEIRTAKGKDDICVSVFKDNSGAIIFDDNWLITDKVETHNSPSALDPFGGAITGIVGVNRDCIGFGKGAKPVLNRYGFCLADPRTNPTYYRGKGKQNKMLSPATIMKGVIHGVNHGGNCSGIPTPQGFLYFDDRYVGKPLVFAGTVGLIPRQINTTPSHEKKAQVGDLIVMVGGKVGRDGIHGATFSSVALDEGSPATAVQIGDPITQKKFSDALIKDIRDLGLYNAITDNGAGGLSSSVGEMAQDTGGFHVELDKVPLKYPGMQPWEIWISESQERMTLAVSPKNFDHLRTLLEKRGVECWAIGTFTNTGQCHITWHGAPIMDMALAFLHDGIPKTPLKTTPIHGGEPEPTLPAPDLSHDLPAMLSRLNICSKEFVAVQYDHNVQGSAVLGPLQGRGRVCAEATVSRPVLNSPRGVVLSQGLCPRYSDIDTYAMAAAALDMAVRNALASGCPLNHLAILDNFCWCSSEDPQRLYQLKKACQAIYDLAIAYQTPFISGKDSMFNDFKGYDKHDQPVKISIQPTLLVSGIGVLPHVELAVSIDPKMAGDFIYVLGKTRHELGGSEYYAHHNHLGQNIPITNIHENLPLYQKLSTATAKRLLASCMAVTLGGLGVTLAKKAIAGQMGMDLSIDIDLPLDVALFSESTGRFVVTVAPEDVAAFESHFGPLAHKIGVMTDAPTLSINNHTFDLQGLEEAYKAPLRGF